LECLASAGAASQRGDKGSEILTDIQRHFGVRKHTPNWTRQLFVANLADPAPPGIVNRQSEARPEHCARLVGKPASGEVDAAKLCFSKAAARRERCLIRGGDNSREGAFEILYDLGTKSG
jgi:hypothetical protein